MQCRQRINKLETNKKMCDFFRIRVNSNYGIDKYFPGEFKMLLVIITLAPTWDRNPIRMNPIYSEICIGTNP